MAQQVVFRPLIFSGEEVLAIDGAGRAMIRDTNDAHALVSLRGDLRTAAAGRGRWLLWTWLLLLSGVTVTATEFEGSGALLLVATWALIVLAIVLYVGRLRRRAGRADAWLSEIDFRLAQLAARGDG